MPESLVLLHGFTQTGASWRPVIARVAERYRALAPDIRGHGDAGDRRPITFEACVRDLLDAAPERFVLAGYSMGGRLALHAALADPARATALILIGATAGIGDPLEREARRAADDELADELENSTIEKFARRWARQPLLRGQPEAVAVAAHEDRLRNTPAGLATALRGIGVGSMQPLWSRLSELGMPVTLIAGERDAKYIALARRMGERIRDARLLVVPATGHAVHLEAPEVVAACLDE